MGHPFHEGTYVLESVAAGKLTGLEPPQAWPGESSSEHFWEVKNISYSQHLPLK